LPVTEASLEGLASSDAVTAHWPDKFSATIPDMTVRKLRTIIETARKKAGEVFKPLWIGEVIRNHNKLLVELLVDRDLLMIITEQGRQVLQIRVDRWCAEHGELPGQQPCRAPDDHPAVQACLKFLMPLVDQYANGEIMGKADLQKARDKKLKDENMPRPRPTATPRERKLGTFAAATAATGKPSQQRRAANQEKEPADAKAAATEAEAIRTAALELDDVDPRVNPRMASAQVPTPDPTEGARRRISCKTEVAPAGKATGKTKGKRAKKQLKRVKSEAERPAQAATKKEPGVKLEPVVKSEKPIKQELAAEANATARIKPKDTTQRIKATTSTSVKDSSAATEALPKKRARVTAGPSTQCQEPMPPIPLSLGEEFEQCMGFQECPSD
jgi:hypothetical protein